MQDCEMLVIGSGPSGRRAAVQSAKLGKSVLVVDRGRRLGGVSVHTGTIPSKTIRETVLNLSGFRERGFYGQAYRVKQEIAMTDLVSRLHKTLDHEVEVLQHQFMRNTVRSAHAAARFIGPDRVRLSLGNGDFSEVRFANALIAVGTRPYRPKNIPFDGTRVLDSDEILDLPRLPRTLAVIGGGVIGVEYATIFSALDVPVTLIESRPAILDFVDREIVDDFVHQMRDRGMTVRLGCGVASVETKGDHVEVRMADGRIVRAEIVLYAAGRTGNVDDLGLDAVGIEPDGRGRITVDPRTFQTSASNIYAAGDIIGFPSLASTSMEQGRGLPRLRHASAAGPGDLSLRHLRGSGDIDRRRVGGRSEGERRALRMRHRALPGNLARPYHGRQFWFPEADLLARDPQAARRPHRRRGRDRTDPHRPGGDQSRRHGRLLRREHLQLSDARGSLQDRRPRCLEPHGDALIQPCVRAIQAWLAAAAACRMAVAALV